MTADELVEVLGVYDADGGVRGELAYAVGKVLGRTHCGLCDVTHTTVRRKAAWNALVERAAVPIRVVHRNEVTEPEAAALAAHDLPCVLGRRRDDTFTLLLAAADLDAMNGSVEAFAQALPDDVVARPRR